MADATLINLALLKPEVILRILIEAMKNGDSLLIKTIVDFVKKEHSIETYVKKMENL